MSAELATKYGVVGFDLRAKAAMLEQGREAADEIEAGLSKNMSEFNGFIGAVNAVHFDHTTGKVIAMSIEDARNEIAELPDARSGFEEFLKKVGLNERKNG